MRAMKDSGVEWIGEIPSDWELNKIGSVYEERSIKVSDKDYAALSVTKQGVVPQLENAAKTENGDNRKLIKINDFVINSRSDRRGSCGISEYDGSCSLINTVLKPRRNMCNAYYSFVFRSELFADEFYRWGNGIVDDLWSTKWSSMKNIYIPFPSVSTQQRIADYLDEKCGKIDAIIEREQAVIENLNEYKQSIITEAVTKGLNPHAEMKDSGIEWIGKIPAHWNVARLKNMCNKIADGTHFSPEIKDFGMPYLTAKDIQGDKIDYDKASKISIEDYDKLVKDKCNPEYGDVLIVKDGATTGRVGIKMDNEPCVILSSVAMLHPNDSITTSHYLKYIIESRTMQEQIKISMGGSAMPRTTLTKIMDYWGAFPAIYEQNEVVAFLDLKCAKIDKTIETKQSVIDKLTEYKKSLIYEVVTGKKEI